jgi:hypothetical protein
MATRYRIERTTQGWWLVISRRWLRWRKDEFLFNTRELAEDRLRDLEEAETRPAGLAHAEPAHQPQPTLSPQRRLQIASR